MNRSTVQGDHASKPSMDVSAGGQSAPTAIPVRRSAWEMPALVVLYLLFATLHAMVAPVGSTGYQNAPDEAAHVSYVRSLASGHLPSEQAPLAVGQAPAPSYEWHQPPLYYVLAVPLSNLGDHGLRFISVVFGVGCILFAYRAVRIAFPERPLLATLAAGILALTPTHVAITSTVNNDSLLELCFSATLLTLVFSFRNGFTLRRAAVLGVCLGAAILTKATALLLVPITVFGLGLMWRAGEKPPVIVRGALVATGVTLCISGWWFLRNILLYGEALPLQRFSAAFAGTMRAETVATLWGGWAAYLFRMAIGIFQSFWAVYGRREDAAFGVPRFLPGSVYIVLAIVVGTACIGMAKSHLRRDTEFSRTQVYVVWTLLAAFVIVSVSFLLFILRYFQMQGRYLFPAMLPICFVLALGWQSVFPEKYRAVASVLLLGYLAALCADLLIAL